MNLLKSERKLPIHTPESSHNLSINIFSSPAKKLMYQPVHKNNVSFSRNNWHSLGSYKKAHHATHYEA